MLLNKLAKGSVILCLFFITACSNDKIQLPLLPKNAVILAFGDSLTYGTGAKQNESYPAVLQQLSGRTVINAGVPGEVSEAGLKRLPELLAKHKPQLLILCHGGNDLLRKKSVADMESNIRQMIQLAKDKNIAVVLLGVPKPGPFLSVFEVYQQLADATEVAFIAELISDVLSKNKLKSDAVHPNKAGYAMMAEEIYAVLKEAGAL